MISQNKVTSIVLLVLVTVMIVQSQSLFSNFFHDAYADSVIATIPVGTHPWGIAYNPNGNLYVSNNGNNTVSVINGATNTLATGFANPIPVGLNPTYDVANDTIILYVDNSVDNTVSIINGGTNTVIGTPIPVGNNPEGIAFDSANGDLYVADTLGGTVTVINSETNAVVGTISIGAHPIGIAYDPVNGYIYVGNSNGGNTVSVIDGATNTLATGFTNPIPVGTSPVGIAFDPANNNIYVANNADSTVSVINGATNTLATGFTNPIPVGTNPEGVAFDPTNGDLYVPDFNSNAVSVIDGTTNSVTGSIPVGLNPYGIAYDSANGDLYVTNQNDNTVSVIGTGLPSPPPTIFELSPNQGPIEADVSVSFNYFLPLHAYSITIEGLPAADGITNSTGGSHVQFAIPAGALPGLGVLSISDGFNTITKPFTVLPSPNTLLTMYSNATNGAIIGQYINFTYVEKNTGNVPLTNPSVSDSFCSPLTSHTLGSFNEGDLNHNNILDPGESWVFQCMQQDNATGTYTNTATGTGTDPFGNIITWPAYPSERTSLADTINPSSTPVIQSSTGAGPVTFSTDSGQFDILTAGTTVGSGLQAPDGTYPYGLFTWQVTNIAPATSVKVTIAYPNPIPSTAEYFKWLGGTTWVPVVPITISGNTITFTIADNGPYDDDHTLGSISDPSGLILPTDGRISGAGDIGKNIDFTFNVRSDSDAKHATKGTLDYEDSSAKIKLHSDGISFLSVNPTTTAATFVGKGDLDKHKGDVNILASITDPDKKGERDTFSITITDSSGKIIYNNSGTVKGHIKIHKFVDHDNKSDSGISH